MGQNNLAKFIFGLTMLFTLEGCDSSNNTGLLTKKSIIYCSEGSPESFNPQTVTSGVTIDATSNQLYNRLISFKSDDNDIVPSIAKSWHVTRDGKKLTFYLRKDVSFHSTKYFTPTRKLNADDVLFSFNRILDPNHEFHHVSGGKYPFFQSVKFNTLIEDLEKINEYTVRFTLKNSNSSILANLAADFSVILSAEYAQQLAILDKHQQIDLLPIGTGPFKLKEYRAGSFIRYIAHQEYWQKNKTIEQLVFDITPSNTGRLTKLLTGECDITAYPIAHQKIINRPDLTLDSVTSFNIGYLGFNTKKPPFNNKLVRQAVALAINKEAIIDTIYFGKADIANTIIPKASWAYNEDEKTQVYSISKAKELLDLAGYSEGLTIDIWAMQEPRAYNPDALTMAKLIQADLKKINITVHIESSFEWGTFLKRLALGEHQSVLLGWSADHPDPDNFFTPLLSCASADAGNNRTFWCNKVFDELLQSALQTTNINLRKQYYVKALDIIADDVPVVPIAHSKRFQARSKRVTGKILNSFGGINFVGVSKN
ncbi:MAG: cationic peptide transport system substrate-binding protein [Oleiphilaceae bacterium]|jgi:cationic peptide transport system substrate-binding protein